MHNTGSAILPQGTKARRVYLSLRDQICAGGLAALPPEVELARLHGVSRVTVRRALDALEDERLIERRVGSGTRVRIGAGPPAAMDAGTLMPQLVEMGQNSVAQLLAFSYGPAPDHVARAMGLEPGEAVQIATRVRSADGVPFSHLTTYVPARVARSYSEADLATTPLYQLLERSGVRISDAHQSVSATLAGPDVAEALGTSVGAALLSVSRVVRDDAGNGVEFLAGLYRPDRFRLDMPLTRVEQRWQPATGGTA